MQRIAVARALAAGAKLLLLDEPLGQLDAKVRNELRYEIRRMTKDLALTAIHVTHDQAEAMAISDRISVMKKGKVLQVGTPKELYMNPESIFVAHFIGESNFLEGYVLSESSKKALIELRGGIKVSAANKTMKKGERVVLAIRPEIFVIEKEVKKGENSLLGVIERVSFEGTNVQYEVRLENQDLIMVVKPSLIGELFNIGEKVTLSFPFEKAHVFAYPEAGLREEISVE
jgi:ABC-type Fe3+/spermidine/putrescine transport system ATPase subunit